MSTHTPTGSRVVDSINPYSSKVVKIAIGPQKLPFSIHRAKLEILTSFFDIHGGPLNTPTRHSPAPPSEASSDGVIVPLSEDGDVSMKSEYGDQVAESDNGAKEKADYTIIDRFHTVGAFKVLTNWLYNEPPKMPTNRIQCKNLLQAYVLARQYKAYDLQNLILDRFRDHHSSYSLGEYFPFCVDVGSPASLKTPAYRKTIDLDNLVWLANRIGDNTEDCTLTAYFVEQTAFEIVDRGYGEFDTNNMFFKTFLAEGDWMIRLELFKALARHSQASGGRLGDPAKSQTENWHVEVAGEKAGKMKVGVKRGIPSRTRQAKGSGS